MMDEDLGRNPTGFEAVLCQQVPGPMTLLAEETLYAAGWQAGGPDKRCVSTDASSMAALVCRRSGLQ